MKKFNLFLCAVALLVAGCAKDHLPEPVRGEAGQQEAGRPEVPGTPLQIDLQIGQGAATKAVKAGWEAGDMVMVFFPGLSAANKDKYLTVVYTVNEETGIAQWLPALMSEAPAVEDLEASGPMTALFLPYGKGTMASWDAAEGRYVLSRTDYAYFLRAENATYTVEDSTLKGTLDMYVPDSFVQFFLPITPEDPAAFDAYHDEGAWYTLRQDHLIPTGAAGVAADGSVLTDQQPAGDPIDGFDYAGGYQFSGVLTAAADGTSQHYWFTLKNNSLNRNFTYFSPAKTLAGGKAVRLPAAGSWQEVGPDKWVDLGYGTEWASCNEGASFPTEAGGYYDPMVPRGPSRADYTDLKSGTQQYAMSVHGMGGVVFKSKTGNNAIFLPASGYSGILMLGQTYDYGIQGYYCCRDVEDRTVMSGIKCHYYFTITDLQLNPLPETSMRYPDIYNVRYCRTSSNASLGSYDYYNLD